MPTLVTTLSGTNANSYVDQAFADTYVSDYVYLESDRDAWADLSADDKARLLIHATRQIDWYFCWQGARSVPEQALEWPRRGVWRETVLQSETFIPLELKHAVVEMALWLKSQDVETPVSDDYQFDSIAVGPIKINMNEKAGGVARRYLPDHVVSLLQMYGEAHNPAIPAQGQARSIRLVRG